MGTYNIIVHGRNVKVNTADCPIAVDTLINTFRSDNFSATTVFPRKKETNFNKSNDVTKVVGIDLKLKPPGCGEILVLFRRSNCLIIHLEYLSNSLPQSLFDFLTDPDICFVGEELAEKQLRSRFHSQFKGSDGDLAVKAGELASRVLRKPGLIDSSLTDLACEVGVSYDGPTKGTGWNIVNVDARNTRVLTSEQVKDAISDAAAYYYIGNKLLSSL